MPEKTIKRRLEDTRDSALASDDGPIFSTVAKLVEALKRSIPEGTQNAERKKKPCASRVNYSAEQIRGNVIVRYVDNQGRPLRQLEVCDGHADLIVRHEQHGGAAVRDLRG